ncbi:MAG TPA: hypothetical protein VKY59_15780 [Spirillospora sp.]|nr:hypothetical protein [Spirillospora sp.]
MGAHTGAPAGQAPANSSGNATLTDLANGLGAFVTVFISNQVMLLRRPLH